MSMPPPEPVAAAPSAVPPPPPAPAPTEQLAEAKPKELSNEAEHLSDLYRQMILIRRLEEEAARAYAMGKIGGFLHLYIGQEAVAVGSIAALQPTDYVV